MQAKDYLKKIDAAIETYTGDVMLLESAVGTLLVGRHLGWKPLVLMHDKKTLRKYEKILGISFREALDAVGPKAHKSAAWNLSQKISNFWKAVSGEIPGIRNPKISKGG